MNLLSADIGNDFFVSRPNGFLSHTGDIGLLVTNFISNALIVAGLILLVYIIVAGIGLISSAGSDNPESMEKGKKAVTSALLGFIVVFCAYWIVQLISKLTGIDIVPTL